MAVGLPARLGARHAWPINAPSAASGFLLHSCAPVRVLRSLPVSSTKPRALIAVAYEDWAQAYLRSLPPEHFMESTGQSTQREITLESLSLVKARRSDVHVFNELLVQYPLPNQRRPGQVVPDNMAVLHEGPLEAETSYNLPLEPAAPFWMLEYVSKSNKRKDYEDNFDKYERDLKVPYYLVFYPEAQDLTLYRHTGKKYVSVKPNKEGRCEFRNWISRWDSWCGLFISRRALAPGSRNRQTNRTLARAG
jgi:Uma2 family endonuclease